MCPTTTNRRWRGVPPPDSRSPWEVMDLSRFVEIPLPDGAALIVEADEEPSDGVVRAGRARELAEDVAESFEDAMDRVRHAAAAVVDRMKSLAEPPDQVSVEFSVKLGAEAGVVIAKTSVEANLVVQLHWSLNRRP